MAEMFETVRGQVAAWECDTVEHFTVAYYYEKFSDAALGSSEALGLGKTYMEETGRACATVDTYTRYLSELRGGDIWHIESGLIEIEGKRIKLGHKMFNSATDEVAATVEQTMIHFDMSERKSEPFAEADLARLQPRIIAWDGEPRETRPRPVADAEMALTGRDTTKPWEVDVIGHVGFQFYVHRFSAAMGHFLSDIGATPEVMRERRHGFSTFEFQMQFFSELSAGDLVEVRTGLAHLGGSSMRAVHRLYNRRTGELSAELSQFGVLLNLDRRRPERISDEIRERASALVVPLAEV